ncbi:MAG: hypothetical protein RR177_01885 [Oscillospiraceae bacterium]
MDKQKILHTKVYWTIVIVYIISTLSIGIYQLSISGIGVAWKAFVGMLFLLIPLILRKLFKFKASDKIDEVLFIFIFIAYMTGVVLKLYHYILWYDIAMHFACGFLFFEIGLCVWFYLKGSNNLSFTHDALLSGAFSFCFVQLISLAWELIEYSGFVFFGYDSQHMDTGVVDTMDDIFICLIGSMLMALIWYLRAKGKKVFLFLPSEEFYKNNFKNQ